MTSSRSLRPTFVERMIGTSLHDEEAYNFNFEDLLGRECLLNVVHDEKNGNVYANIKGATPLPNGMIAPEQFNASKVIDVNTSPVAEIEALPEFIKTKIFSSEEWIGRLRHEENMRGGDGTKLEPCQPERPLRCR